MSRSDTLLFGYATNAARVFRGRNGRVASGRVVHRVHWERWLDGAEVPAPACRVGVAGWLPWQLQPTSEHVSCGRCLRADPAAARFQPSPGQLHLFPAA